jgi:hypothetical protein
MIQEYSVREFTNASDKLTAVAGLAEAMQPSLKGDYLLGVWTGDLRNEVRWIRTYGGEHHRANLKSYINFMVLGVDQFPSILEQCLGRASW